MNRHLFSACPIAERSTSDRGLEPPPLRQHPSPVAWARSRPALLPSRESGAEEGHEEQGTTRGQRRRFPTSVRPPELFVDEKEGLWVPSWPASDPLTEDGRTDGTGTQVREPRTEEETHPGKQSVSVHRRPRVSRKVPEARAARCPCRPACWLPRPMATMRSRIEPSAFLASAVSWASRACSATVSCGGFFLPPFVSPATGDLRARGRRSA